MATPKREQIIQDADKLVQRGKLDAAIKEYRRALELMPNDTNTLNRLGDLLVRVSRIPEAIEVYQKIAEHFAQDGFFLKAIAIYKKVNRLDPQRTETYELLADLYFKQGLVVEGRQQLMTLADWFMRSRRAEEAVRVFRRLTELEPDNFQARAKLVDLLVQVGDTKAVTTEIDTLGRALLSRNMLEEAVKLYHRALDLHPEDVGFVVPCVDALVTGGRAAQALELAKKALQGGRAQTEVKRAAARAASESGDLKLARKFLEELMPEVGERTDVVQLYGDIMLRVGESEEAKEHILPTVDRLLRAGDVARAAALIKRLLRTTPTDIEVLERAGKIFDKLNDRDMVATIEVALAESYLRVRRTEDATRVYQKLVRSGPSEADFRNRLEALRLALKIPSETPAPPVPKEAGPPAVRGKAAEAEVEFVEVSFDEEIPGQIPTEPPPPEDDFTAVAAGFTPRPIAMGPSIPPAAELPQLRPAAGAAPTAPPSPADELFTEALVFAKYGLADKAVSHLRRLLVSVPGHEKGLELLHSLGGAVEDTAPVPRAVAPPVVPGPVPVSPTPMFSTPGPTPPPETPAASRAEEHRWAPEEIETFPAEPLPPEPERVMLNEDTWAGNLPPVSATGEVSVPPTGAQGLVAEDGFEISQLAAELAEELPEIPEAAGDQPVEVESARLEAGPEPEWTEVEPSIGPPAQTELPGPLDRAEELGARVPPAPQPVPPPPVPPQDLPQAGDRRGPRLSLDDLTSPAAHALESPAAGGAHGAARRPVRLDTLEAMLGLGAGGPGPAEAAPGPPAPRVAVDEIFAPIPAAPPRRVPVAPPSEISLDLGSLGLARKPEPVSRRGPAPPREIPGLDGLVRGAGAEPPPSPAAEPGPAAAAPSEGEMVAPAAEPPAVPMAEPAPVQTPAAGPEEGAVGVQAPPPAPEVGVEAPPTAAPAHLGAESLDTGPEGVEESMSLVEVGELLEGPAPDQLGELDFFIQQGLLDEAAKLLGKLRDSYPEHPELRTRQALLKARGWDEEKPMVSTEASASELFSEEEHFFDLAAELEKELEEDELVAEATGAGKGQEASIEDLFREFQRGVAEQINEEDFDTHFNLGLAYREMGLLDEAIGEFQLSLRSQELFIESASMIGACYLEKGLPEQAAEWYARGLTAPQLPPETALGLRYELGRAQEMAGRVSEALGNFAQVLAINPGFRDVVERVSRLRTN